MTSFIINSFLLGSKITTLHKFAFHSLLIDCIFHVQILILCNQYRIYLETTSFRCQVLLRTAPVSSIQCLRIDYSSADLWFPGFQAVYRRHHTPRSYRIHHLLIPLSLAPRRPLVLIHLLPFLVFLFTLFRAFLVLEFVVCSGGLLLPVFLNICQVLSQYQIYHQGEHAYSCR